MKRMIIVLALVALMLLSFGGLALAVQPGNPPLPLGMPHMNSNDTGFFAHVQRGTFGSLVRAVPGQLVHTDFQLDTNSCASCHMTHTAVGENLLFQRTVTDTCWACHDGTIGVLNVLAAPRAADAERFGGSETAGTFGLGHDARFNFSMHDVEGGMRVSGAPGGNRTRDIVDSAGMVSTGWNEPFSCTSCHAPHGSHSIRLLHSNPNNLGWRSQNHAAGTDFATGGLWSSGNTLTIGGLVAGEVYRSVTVTAGVYGGVNNDIAAPWLHGHPAGFMTITNLRNWGTERFNPGATLNLYATRIYAANIYNPNTAHLPDRGGPFSTVVDGVYLLNRFFNINYGMGTITIDEADRLALANLGVDFNQLRIDIGRALRVTASANPGTLGTEPQSVLRQRLNHINTRTYSQLTYNLFCAACHTDYLPQGVHPNDTAARRAALMTSGYGTYSRAHRHTVNRDATEHRGMTVTGIHATRGDNQLLCVSCHFAHGADERMMRQADHSLNNFNLPRADINASSALKRYVNQAVCWSCHANSQAAVFKNTDYYWNNFNNNRGYRW